MATLLELFDILPKLGWKPVQSCKQNLSIFEGAPDDLGRPLRIVLPCDTNAPDVGYRTQDAIETLIAIHGKAAVYYALRPSIKKNSSNTPRFVNLPSSELIYGGVVQ